MYFTNTSEYLENVNKPIKNNKTKEQWDVLVKAGKYLAFP